MNAMREQIARAALEAPRSGAEGELRQRFRFPADFVGFAGHFPGFPLLPGIVQLLLAQLLVEAGTGAELVLAEVAGAKFLEQLPPETEIAVSCRPRAGAEGWWQARLETGGRLAASFQLRLAATS